MSTITGHLSCLLGIQTHTHTHNETKTEKYCLENKIIIIINAEPKTSKKNDEEESASCCSIDDHTKYKAKTTTKMASGNDNRQAKRIRNEWQARNSRAAFQHFNR